MLKGLDPLLSPELLYLLARMGHGDDLAVLDGNHPAETIAKASVSGMLVRMPGVPVDRLVAAILSVFPVDDFVDDPLRVMAPVDDPDSTPPGMHDILEAVKKSGHAGPVVRIERYAFYETAKKCYGVVHCGDPRFFSNILIRKGAIEGPRP